MIQTTLTKKRSASVDIAPESKRVRTNGNVAIPPAWENSRHRDNLVHLVSHGYAKFSNVVSDKESIKRALKGCYRQLKQLCPELDMETQSMDEIRRNMPASLRGIFQQFRMGNVQEVCDVKYSEEVIDFFRLLWARQDGTLPQHMIASSDAISIMLPHFRTPSARDAWGHVDQSPARKPLHFSGATCYQGLIVATHHLEKNAQTGKNEIVLVHHAKEDGGLCVIHDSANQFSTAMAKVGVTESKNDWYKFDTKNNPDIVKQLYGTDVYTRIEAEPGDLIVWDSRTVHYGSRPDCGRPTIRAAFYICMMPREFATPKQLEARWRIFQKGQCTSHWPYGGRAFPDTMNHRGNEKIKTANANLDKSYRPHVAQPQLFGAPLV